MSAALDLMDDLKLRVHFGTEIREDEAHVACRGHSGGRVAGTMAMTADLRVAGVYAVRPGYRAVRDALKRNGGRAGVREALAALVLIEIEVRGAPSAPNLGDWHQQNGDQVPWDEVYTTLDRSTVIARMYDAPPGGDFAVSFFLHCFDQSRRFETPWGNLPLRASQEQRPEHLSDRVYVYPS